METWLDAQLNRISGKSELAKAIRYALGRMKKMRGYLNNGSLEIDTNSAERSIRCVALGRKNFLFVGSKGGGEAGVLQGWEGGQARVLLARVEVLWWSSGARNRSR